MSTGGHGGDMQFSMATPFKGTPRGLAFAKNSLLPTAALGPGEMAVGVDRTDGGAAARFVEEVRRQHGSGGALNITRVERSGAQWFHLASTVWHCCKASRDDTVLVFGIVAVLHAVTIRNLEPVGGDGNAAVSTTKRILTRNITEQKIQLASLRVRATTGASAFAGLYWVRLPYCFAGVREVGIASIANGPNYCVVMAIRVNGTHKAMTLPDIGEGLPTYRTPTTPRCSLATTSGTTRAVVAVAGYAAAGAHRRCRYESEASSSRDRRGYAAAGAHRRCRGCQGDCMLAPAPPEMVVGPVVPQLVSVCGGAAMHVRQVDYGARASIVRNLGNLDRRETGVMDKNNSAGSAVSPARSDARGRQQKLANVRRKGIKGRRYSHCPMNGARRRDT